MCRLGFLGVVLIVLFGLGCKSNDNVTNSSEVTSVILPLAVGNEWIYAHNSTQPPDTHRVLSDTTIDGETWYLWQSQAGTVIPAINRSTGLWINSGGVEYRFLKYPASSGDTYQFTNLQATVESTRDSVEVPGGFHFCWKYVFTYAGNNALILFAAPDIGIVRWEEWNAETNQLAERLLLTGRNF